MGAVIPPAFEYVRPASIEEAVKALQRYKGEARVLAGGHSLLPLMRLRLAQPPALVDIGRLPGLREIREDGGDLLIGALCTHDTIERSPVIAAKARALHDAAAVLGDPQVRNRGTIGGELCHADPAADYGAALLALGGELIIAGPGGHRTLALDDWYRGPFTTALDADEILTDIRLPGMGAHEGSAYRKFARRANDYGMVGVAARLRLDEAGRCSAARVAVTCVADHPYRARAAEAVLIGRRPEEAAQEAAARIVDGIEVAADPFCPAEYRAHLAEVEAARTIADAGKAA